MGALIASTGGLSGLPQPGVAPTPIVFGTPSASSGVPKTTLPPGLAVAPPTPAASPGSLGAQPPGVVLAPPASSTPSDDEDEPGEEDEDGPVASASPAPGASTGAPSPAGEQVKVSETDGTGVNMRERPGAAGPVIKTIPDGAVLLVVGEDRQMDGKAWKNVRDDTGSTGWIAAELLEPA
jgi:hypothetical protein